MDYTQIVIGMLGQQFADAINHNFGNAKTAVEALQAGLLLRVLGNNVKQIKVQDGIFYYTLDNTNWVPVNTTSWGSILGDITNQTDLKNLLATKASTSSVNTLSNAVTTLSSDVNGLSTTVANLSGTVASNTSDIGSLQTNIQNKVSSTTIKSFRIGSSGYLEYSLDGVAWQTVSSVSTPSWGSILGTLSNQVDLQNALDAKANNSALTNHVNNKQNPHQVTKAQIGLGNVDNTSDLNKPISKAQQKALDDLSLLITGLKTSKVTNIDAVTGVQHISLANYNGLIEAGTIVPTVLYIVEE